MSFYKKGNTSAAIPGFHPFQVRKIVRQLESMTDEQKAAFIEYMEKEHGITKQEVVQDPGLKEEIVGLD